MACPNCGSVNNAAIVIEETYEGTYNPETEETTIDYNLGCVRTVSVICPDCGEDYPSSSIANPE